MSPLYGAGGQSGPHRVERHIAHRRHQVCLVHGERGETAIEQLPAPRPRALTKFAHRRCAAPSAWAWPPSPPACRAAALGPGAMNWRSRRRARRVSAPPYASVIRGLVPRTHSRGSREISNRALFVAERAGGPESVGLACDAGVGPRCARNPGIHGPHGSRLWRCSAQSAAKVGLGGPAPAWARVRCSCLLIRPPDSADAPARNPASAATEIARVRDCCSRFRPRGCSSTRTDHPGSPDHRPHRCRGSGRRHSRTGRSAGTGRRRRHRRGLCSGRAAPPGSRSGRCRQSVSHPRPPARQRRHRHRSRSLRPPRPSGR